jgi:hypothetical protein
MGGGEFIPNGSIHWDIEEEEVTGNGGNVNRKKTRPNLRGRDPIQPDLVGKGKGGKDHPNTLRVTLRFRTDAEARNALQAAVNTLKRNPQSQLWEIEVTVPVSIADADEANRPSPNDWAQARVEW